MTRRICLRNSRLQTHLWLAEWPGVHNTDCVHNGYTPEPPAPMAIFPREQRFADEELVDSLAFDKIGCV